MEQDPSFAAGTFVYEVHPFNVFYAGELQTPRRGAGHGAGASSDSLSAQSP
jgi:hypothetical protein